jgi:dethiobiotin synthetase
MTKRIFISATNTDIGKTYTTKLLIKEFAKKSLRVGVIKPIETGVKAGLYPDGDELLKSVREFNEAFEALHVEDIVPISFELPSAPYVANKNKKIDLSLIDKAVKKVESLCDVLLIEGAGGLYVPLFDDFMMIDLIEYLEAKTLLVTHCSLGCINDTLLSKKALEDKKLAHIVAFNCRDEDKSFKDVSEPYFIKSGFDLLKVGEDMDKICDVLYNL